MTLQSNMRLPHGSQAARARWCGAHASRDHDLSSACALDPVVIQKPAEGIGVADRGRMVVHFVTGKHGPRAQLRSRDHQAGSLVTSLVLQQSDAICPAQTAR